MLWGEYIDTIGYKGLFFYCSATHMWRDTDGSGASALGDGEGGRQVYKTAPICSVWLNTLKYLLRSTQIRSNQSQTVHAFVCTHSYIHTSI